MRYFDRSEMMYPDFLDSSMVEKGRGIVATYIENTMSKGGQRRAPNLNRLLSEPALVDALHWGFNGCCAFCETRSEKSDEAWVGHFRPMQLAEDRKGNTSLVHYIWLALDWQNLFYVCPDCARLKANKFFVEGARGTSDDDVANLRAHELENFLDPTWIDPDEALKFSVTGGVQDNKSPRGRAAIDLLDLNRPALINGRRNAIRTAVDVLMAGGLWVPNPEGDAKAQLVAPIADDGPWPFAHQGAVSNVLARWARDNTQTDDLRGFVELVSELDADTKKEMSDEILLPPLTDKPAAKMSAPPKQAASPPPKKRKASSRIPRLKTMPLAGAQIHKVHIENFKALREISFELPTEVTPPANSSVTRQVPCMLILGENATGKSSVLEALTLSLLGTSEINHLDDMLQDETLTPQDMIHRPDVTNWEVLSDKPLSVKVGYLDQDDSSTLSGLANAPTFFGTAAASKILLSYGPRRYFRKGKHYRRRAPAYRVQSQFDPLITIADPTEWLLRCPEDKFLAAARALRVVLMLEEEQYFEREWDDAGKGRVIIDTPGGRTPLSEMSVGYKSVVAMATDIIRELFYYYDNTEFAHAVVLIDEIETHLHPRWKMRIVGLLREAFPFVQFIITTHDPLCLRGMYDGEVFVLQRSTEDARVETLSDLPSLKGMRAEQILLSEFFGLGSTDPDTEATLMRYNNLLAKRDKSDAEENEQSDLQKEIEDTMKVGDTVQEQLFTDAMVKANIDPLAPVGKIKTKSRKDLTQDLLAAIQSARRSRKPTPDRDNLIERGKASRLTDSDEQGGAP